MSWYSVTIQRTLPPARFYRALGLEAPPGQRTADRTIASASARTAGSSTGPTGALTSVKAQGANQALEDAWLLDRALAGDGPVEPPLRRYEKVRARRVRRVSRLAATEVTNRPPNAVGRLAGKVLSPALAGRAHLALIRRFSSVLSTDAI